VAAVAHRPVQVRRRFSPNGLTWRRRIRRLAERFLRVDYGGTGQRGQ